MELKILFNVRIDSDKEKNSFFLSKYAMRWRLFFAFSRYPHSQLPWNLFHRDFNIILSKYVSPNKYFSIRTTLRFNHNIWDGDCFPMLFSIFSTYYTYVHIKLTQSGVCLSHVAIGSMLQLSMRDREREVSCYAWEVHVKEWNHGWLKTIFFKFLTLVFWYSNFNFIHTPGWHWT